VVRHPLVQRIVVAYEAEDRRREGEHLSGGRSARDWMGRTGDEVGQPRSGAAERPDTSSAGFEAETAPESGDPAGATLPVD
jgi:hypothetical protein